MTHREHVEEMVKVALFEHVGLLTKEAMTGRIAPSAVKAIGGAARTARPIAPQSARTGWLHKLFSPKPKRVMRPNGIRRRTGYSTTSHLRGATA